MNTFRIFPQLETAAAAAEAGETLNQALLDNKQRPVLLMLSGGSALSLLDYVGQSGLGENLTVTMLDERFSRDPEINNFAQLQKTDFYNDALAAGASFFGTLPRDGETLAELAKRWEANLKNWAEENPGGTILATLGMGPDGHTAGIFPFDDEKKFNALFNFGGWVVAYDADSKSKYAERLTVSLTFFKLIGLGLAFVCGPEKQEKFKLLVHNRLSPHTLPAVAWREIKDVRVFTDLK